MDELEKSVISEEYSIWRKNVPFLYDLMYSAALKWSSPSVQWFPCAERLENRITVQKLLMTTFTNGEDQENLLFAQVTFPDIVDDDCVGNGEMSLKITQSIPLPIDINKARYSPLATNIIACATPTDKIFVYDYTKHPSSGSQTGPDITYKGHDGGGFALSWNKSIWSEFVTGGRDGKVKAFDINKGELWSWAVHTAVVNDVSCSYGNPHVLASVSDDYSLAIHDIRMKTTGEECVRVAKCHTSTVEACAFSSLKTELISTAGHSGEIKVWDTRNTESPLFVLRSHKGSVNALKWSPHYESIIASGSVDRRVMVWDLNKTDLVTEEGVESPELCFVHSGHTNTVDDIDWNPAEPFEIASVSNDGILCIWKVSSEIFDK